jgi:SIR2-like domain
VTHVLLTGAGFSRNWGGWLANEAFEYLLGCPEIDDHLRHLLWTHKKRGGGFEDALAELQLEYNHSKDDRAKKKLDDLQAAIVGMFNEMNNAFVEITFEPQNLGQYLIKNFLARFDAIFTLNQDLLLERHYLRDNISISSTGKLTRFQIPGMRPYNPSSQGSDPDPPYARAQTPDDPANFKEQPGAQPYYKLHGSTNWIGGGGQARLLIMGGNKAVEINQYPLLAWYHKKFDEYLSRGTRLLVIGYSFSDHHINHAIMAAADKDNLRLFIIDPQGVDVLNKQDPRHIQHETDLMARLNPYVIGASRRSLIATFSSDRVEHGRLTRFFAP